MAGVLPEAALPGRHGGYAAVGPLGLDGRGFSVNRCAWRPILSTKDANGEAWGPAAAILHHFNGTFAGSSWAFFGIDDVDVFADGSQVREKMLAPLVAKLVSRTFLHETESDWAAYDRGETAKLKTRASNFSKQARKGRVPIIVTLEQLDEEAMLSILTEPKNALSKQYARLFEMDGVKLEIEREALLEVARISIARNTGARGLRAILEDVMLPVMYELPSRNDVEKVIITAAAVRKEAGPTYVLKSESVPEDGTPAAS